MFEMFEKLESADNVDKFILTSIGYFGTGSERFFAQYCECKKRLQRDKVRIKKFFNNQGYVFLNRSFDNIKDARDYLRIKFSF